MSLGLRAVRNRGVQILWQAKVHKANAAFKPNWVIIRSEYPRIFDRYPELWRLGLLSGIL